MQKTILVGGKAGHGTAVTSHFIGKVFCSLGYYVFNYRDYPSLIRGGHNFNVLKISDKPVLSHDNNHDLIIAFDQKTIDLHQEELKPEGVILGGKELTGKNIVNIDAESILKKLNAPEIMENNIFLGWVFKSFGIDKNVLFDMMAKKFKGEKLEMIKKSIGEGYELSEEKESLKSIGSPKYFISGSHGVSVGALTAGIDAYIAYPMTPATPVLHHLAGKQIDHNFLVLQTENEIGVVNAAMGSSFSGAKTMVGTSGGGLALMSETLSMAGISEIPLVVYLAQRTGPASGVPTYTAQSDLKMAVNAGHGEFPKVIVAPGDAKESIIRTQEAFYLASKYKTLAIIVADKHVAESDYSFDNLDGSNVDSKRFIEDNLSDDHKSYKITDDGISPRGVPGQGPVVRATSYEHNEYGNTTEDAEMIKKMNDKRIKKGKCLEGEVNKLNPVSVYGEGENLIVGWGSTKGAILDALPSLENYRFLQVSYITPFPK